VLLYQYLQARNREEISVEKLAVRLSSFFAENFTLWDRQGRFVQCIFFVMAYFNSLELVQDGAHSALRKHLLADPEKMGERWAKGDDNEK
jgi:hypothetical protein